MDVSELVSILLLGIFVCSSLIVLALRTWVAERIKNQIKNDYDRDIEAFKARLKSTYDEKLETHRAELKAQTDVEIEQLKSRLNIAALQHQIRFARLHEKRAEVISQLYVDLAEFVAAMTEYTNPWINRSHPRLR